MGVDVSDDGNVKMWDSTGAAFAPPVPRASSMPDGLDTERSVLNAGRCAPAGNVRQ